MQTATSEPSAALPLKHQRSWEQSGEVRLKTEWLEATDLILSRTTSALLPKPLVFQWERCTRRR